MPADAIPRTSVQRGLLPSSSFQPGPRVLALPRRLLYLKTLRTTSKQPNSRHEVVECATWAVKSVDAPEKQRIRGHIGVLIWLFTVLAWRREPILGVDCTSRCSGLAGWERIRQSPDSGLLACTIIDWRLVTVFHVLRFFQCLTKSNADAIMAFEHRGSENRSSLV